MSTQLAGYVSNPTRVKSECNVAPQCSKQNNPSQCQLIQNSIVLSNVTK